MRCPDIWQKERAGLVSVQNKIWESKVRCKDCRGQEKSNELWRKDPWMPSASVWRKCWQSSCRVVCAWKLYTMIYMNHVQSWQFASVHAAWKRRLSTRSLCFQYCIVGRSQFNPLEYFRSESEKKTQSKQLNYGSPIKWISPLLDEEIHHERNSTGANKGTGKYSSWPK